MVLRQFVFTLATTGFLMGCVEGAGTTGAGETADAPAPKAKKGKPKDVEAPEIFQTSDSALWDGRPSLGGIWVASPNVTDPERVMMFNPATGKSVEGALFRRERDNPGPTLQLSSDAADALGILAGQPTEIRVTALRREEVEEAAPPPEAEPEAAAAAEETPAAADDSEAAAIATAALDAVEAGAAAPAEGTVDPAADGAVPAADAPPKKKTWKERRAEAKAKREAEKAAKAAAAAGEAVPVDGVAPVDGAAPTEGVDPAAGAVATVETAPLDARSAEAVAAGDPAATAPQPETPQPEKKKTRRQIKAEEEAAAKAAAEAAAAAAAGRPIQVASFSKEENAQRAADALAKIGITASPQKSDRKGKAVWGVIVIGDDVMLKKIKDAGFADAYYLQ